MAMTPQERLEFDEMKRTLTALSTVQDVAFIENLKRRVAAPEIADALAVLDLEDLRNVTITTVSSEQVLKYNGTAWVNGTDNI